MGGIKSGVDFLKLVHVTFHDVLVACGQQTNMRQLHAIAANFNTTEQMALIFLFCDKLFLTV